MEHLLQELTPWVQQYGLIVVYLGMIAEGSTMILISGVLCALGMLPFWPTVAVAILGGVSSDQLWYWAGASFGERVLSWFPSYRERAERMLALVDRKAPILATGAHFIYSGAVLFPLVLGLRRYDYGRFLLFDMAGTTLWGVVGVGAGALIGRGAQALFGRIDRIEHIVLILLVVFLTLWAFARWKRKLLQGHRSGEDGGPSL